MNIQKIVTCPSAHVKGYLLVNMLRSCGIKYTNLRKTDMKEGIVFTVMVYAAAYIVAVFVF